MARSGKFDIGKVLSRALEAMRENIGLSLGLALPLAGAPSFLMFWWFNQYGFSQSGFAGDPRLMFETMQTGDFWMPLALVWLVSLFTDAALQVALIHAAVKRLTGQTPGLGECLEIGFVRMLPVLLLNLIIGIGVMLGVLLLIVPGVILALCWAVAVPAYVVEGTGISGAFGRSQDLTRDERWNIFLICLVVMVCMWILNVPVGIIDGFAAGGSPLVPAITGALYTAVSRIVWMTVSATMFVDLRNAKEGGAPSELETIFS